MDEPGGWTSPAPGPARAKPPHVARVSPAAERGAAGGETSRTAGRPPPGPSRSLPVPSVLPCCVPTLPRCLGCRIHPRRVGGSAGGGRDLDSSRAGHQAVLLLGPRHSRGPRAAPSSPAAPHSSPMPGPVETRLSCRLSPRPPRASRSRSRDSAAEPGAPGAGASPALLARAPPRRPAPPSQGGGVGGGGGTPPAAAGGGRQEAGGAGPLPRPLPGVVVFAGRSKRWGARGRLCPECARTPVARKDGVGGDRPVAARGGRGAVRREPRREPRCWSARGAPGRGPGTPALPLLSAASRDRGKSSLDIKRRSDTERPERVL